MKRKPVPNPEDEYSNTMKSMAWAYYWNGYSLGYGVEDMTLMDYKAAKSNFEREWDNE